MRFPFFALFALLLFSTFAVATVDLEPKLIGSSKAVIEITWDIDFNGQRPASSSFTSFNFLNTSYQSASFTSSLPFTTKVDEFENNLITFQLNPALNRQNVTLTSIVDVTDSRFFEDVSGSMDRYVDNSQYVVITPEISAKARELIGSEQNKFKQMAILSAWVYNNVQYDLAYKDRLLPANEVFQVRKGVCNEFSHLLIAMARSVGIPARFSAGYVYSGEIWAAHAWTEVAIDGKWYPFDPTYNEGIVLDATHFKFANGVDQGDVVEQLSATGAVDVSKAVLLRLHRISFLERNNFATPPILRVQVSNVTAASNSVQQVSAMLKSTSNIPVAYPLDLDVPDEVKTLTDRATLIYVLPGQEVYANWSVLMPPNLNKSFVYTFSVIVRSLGVSATSSFQAREGAPVSVSALQVKEVRFKQPDSLSLLIKNSGNTGFSNISVQVTLSNQSYSKVFSLEAGRESEVLFLLSGANFSQQNQVMVRLTAEDYSFAQSYLLSPVSTQVPLLPQFNLQTKRAISANSLFDLIYSKWQFIAIILILLVAIILVKMRS